MRRRKTVLLALAFATALASGATLASSAQAEPAGCQDAASLSGTGGVLSAIAGGACETKATRTLKVEIKWDKALSPDPLVDSAYTTTTSTTYSIGISTCDHGNTRSYYGRSYFTTNTTYHDTATQKIKACG